MGRYPGGKNHDGVWQRIICQIPPIPPGFAFCEAFLGSGAIIRRMRPAGLSIGVDLDPGAIAAFRDGVSRTVALIVADALEWIARRSWGAADVIYCDPPYLPETRSKRRVYQYELTRQDHERLLEILVALPCRVLLSGYPSRLYADRLAGWRVEEYDVSTRGGLRRECLWCNFPEPEELHDYLWIGSDYRDRERIRRRQRNWRRALLAMPPLERNAMLANLNADPLAESGEGDLGSI